MLEINMESLLNMLISGSSQIIVIMILLFIAMRVRHLSTKFDDSSLIADGNIAIGFVSGSYYISITLIIISAIFGDSYGLVDDMLSIFIVGILGIIVLSLNRFLVNATQLRYFNPKDEIEKHNIAFAKE